jgi:hypothetical protein
VRHIGNLDGIVSGKQTVATWDWRGRMYQKERIMRPRQEIEKELKEVVDMPSSIQNMLQLEVLLDIRDILTRIERDQPLGN